MFNQVNSIQTKFIALILSCVTLCSAVIGGVGVMTTKAVIDADSAQIMNLQCSEKTVQLNALLSRIEQSVQTLGIYALDQLESVEQLKENVTYLKEYTHQLEDVAVNAADNTEGAIAVYVRFNPEWAEPTAGLFWGKIARTGNFQRYTPTDFSRYDANDMEHVGWYYTPVKSGKAVWIPPYLNKNINVQMISYVIPLHINNEIIGVVGMDIDYDVIIKQVESMHVYDSGYAFLTDRSGNVMYHRSLPMGTTLESVDPQLQAVVNELENGTSGSTLFSYNWQDEVRSMAFRSLSNEMRLALTAPDREINAAKNRFIIQISIGIFLIASLFTSLTIAMTRRLIRPLKELTSAAQRIAAGDLSISLSHQTNDEVGTLADSFQQTVSHLQRYIDYINGLAYRDALTGVKNKTAYNDAIRSIEHKMRVGHPEFAVAMFDINGLKYVNDNYGHDFGDMLIRDCCKLLCQVFKHSPVYRIGGDEFVIILEGNDFKYYADLLVELERAIAETNREYRAENKISIARGIAVYSYETDLVFNNVFKRADDAMYQNKAAMKEKGGLSQDK